MVEKVVTGPGPGPGALSSAGPAENAHNKDLIRRRAAHLGGSMLFFRDPVHIVRGKGVWLYDEDGRQYLDCYNNVASVGHCHPHVVEAITRQAGLLNTHTRYLHEGVVNYAERLAEKFPDKLDVCLFVCTGTEANELAMRIARTVSGKMGAVVMENAYHGNSVLMNELSTCLTGPDSRPVHVAAVEPPNTSRGPCGPHPQAGERYAVLVGEAIGRLNESGSGLAAFLCDTIFDSQGTLEAPPDYFAQVYRQVRSAGGLCIADEVQAGFARTGTMWGFEHYGVVPDIVTLGKPIGAGHPIGAVITSRENLAQFSQTEIYFNTFGGNPVSAAVGNAVLDVFEDEGLLAHVRDLSPYLRTGLEKLQQRHYRIGDVRGLGLFMGIELVKDRATKEPDRQAALVVAELMREQGVLIGVSGRHGNVIKVRPPLPFSREHVDFLLEKLDVALSAPGTQA
jgi:4-aminobutyrate aminotransferase-like enzyme